MDASKRRGAPITVAVFLAGAVLLGVEIAASRVLSPFFGNSLYVWGSLIGVVLAGLSLGYLAGGALADRKPVPGLLISVILAGGGCVLAIPLLDEHVLEAILSWDPGPRLDPLLASVALFGPASVVLAAVTPIAIRLRAAAIANLGRTAGRLFSVSTVGSIVGTFLTAFWLIPELGTDQLLAVAAATLFAAAGIVAVAERLPLAVACAALALGTATTISLELAPSQGGTLSRVAARNWSPVYRLRGEVGQGPQQDYTGLKVLFRKDTQYHRLAVVEGEGERTLRFDSSYQSAMSLDDPFATLWDYTDYLQLGFAYNPRARDVLFIGLGGGTAPKRVWRDFPALRLQAVELDPVVVDVAYRFFAVPKHPRLRIAARDGRRWLAENDRRWDVIVLDVFFGDGIPFHMTTQEFLELARSRLAPGGVIVTNLIGTVRGDGSKLFRSVYRTYRSVFPTVAVHPVTDGKDSLEDVTLNVILVAREGPAPNEQFLVERWRRIRAAAPAAPDLSGAIRNRLEAPVRIDDVPTLTDDYAPTDSLLLDQS
ncbi:MAG: spermidine synthase [Gaiellaceae bacterium]